MGSDITVSSGRSVAATGGSVWISSGLGSGTTSGAVLLASANGGILGVSGALTLSSGAQPEYLAEPFGSEVARHPTEKEAILVYMQALATLGKVEISQSVQVKVRRELAVEYFLHQALGNPHQVDLF